MTAKDRILDLMCTKVGFFPRVEIDAQVLKYIIAAFPYIIKNKGNITGIQYAVNAILKAEGSPDATGIPRVVVNNKDDSGSMRAYTIYIYTTVSIYNKQALEEVLRYVMPTGYMYQLLAYIDAFDTDIEQFTQTDTVKLLKASTSYTSSVVSNAQLAAKTTRNPEEYLKNTFYTTEVVPLKGYIFDASNNKEVLEDSSAATVLTNVITETQ